MGYSLKLVTPPTTQPVTLCEAKKQVEIADAITYHDDHLLKLVKAATQQAQIKAGRQILSATYRLTMDEFPSEDRFTLPMPPLASVSSIVYLDSAGASQTLATTVYKVLTDSEPGIVALKSGQSWPSVYDEAGAVVVTYVAGASTTTAADEWLKQAILMSVQALWLRDFQQPYERVQRAADMILESHRSGDDFVRYGDE